MVMCRSCSRGPWMAGPQKQEVRAEERLAEWNACFFKNMKMRILDVKEKKKRMEYLAICVITLTMQEFSAYKKTWHRSSWSRGWGGWWGDLIQLLRDGHLSACGWYIPLQTRCPHSANTTCHGRRGIPEFLTLRSIRVGLTAPWFCRSLHCYLHFFSVNVLL